ncbi:MAG: DUF3054 domain-containing protein [Armatimonadota bacterium]|nr:DUF3054 domain-containing protein [Armatimonadota bacterium]
MNARTRTYVVADIAALLAFVGVGLVTHGVPVSAGAVLRTALPLGVAWFALAPACGTYRRPGWRTLLVTWAVAVPAGVLLRQWWLARPLGVATLVFLLTAWLLTLVFLAAGRLVAGRAAAHRQGGTERLPWSRR